MRPSRLLLHRPARRRSAAVVCAVLLALTACGDDSPVDAQDVGGEGNGDPDTETRGAGTDDAAASGDAAQSCGRPGEPLAAADDAAAAAGLSTGDAPRTGDPDQFPTFDEVAIAVEAPSGEVVVSCVLLAVEADQRQQGLMEVTDLAGYEGMLFVAPNEGSQSFWMRNTPMPLTIAWFDDDGQFVSATDMDPCADRMDCPSYGSEGDARFALEVPQGMLDTVGVVGEGSRLQVGGA